MPVVTSPNMNLWVPVVGQEPGPLYAQDIDNSLNLIDAHGHVPGQGVPIVPGAININADLTFNSNNSIALRSCRFTPQSAPLALPADAGCVYVSGADLYYNDTAGHQVRLTSMGGIAGPPGSIAGLVAPASATYVPLISTFYWQSGANTPASMNQGPTTIANQTANAFGVTIVPNASISAAYQLTLPAAPPSTTSVVLMNNSGSLLLDATIPATYITSGTITATQVNSATISSAALVGSVLTSVNTTNTLVTTNSVANYGITSIASFSCSGNFPVRICAPTALLQSTNNSGGGTTGIQAQVYFYLSGSATGVIGSGNGRFIACPEAYALGGGATINNSTPLEWIFMPSGAVAQSYTIFATTVVTANPSGIVLSVSCPDGMYAHEIH